MQYANTYMWCTSMIFFSNWRVSRMLAVRLATGCLQQSWLHNWSARLRCSSIILKQGCPDIITLVTLGRLTAVSLNKNDSSREAVKNKGFVSVKGDRINGPFFTWKDVTQNINLSQNTFSFHIIFDFFTIYFFSIAAVGEGSSLLHLYTYIV